MGKKESFFFVALSKWISYLSKNIYYILFDQMHYMNLAKHKCTQYFSMEEN
jgi:hypothetical protein